MLRATNTPEGEIFVPFAKLDDDQHMVAGFASTQSLDLQGERVAVDAVKAALPDYMQWHGGPPEGNLREMHQPVAVGTCQRAEIVRNGKGESGIALPGLEKSDTDEGLYIVGHVVDPLAWKKCKEGVYKGFSLGGQKQVKRGDLVTKIALHEISLVDRPANPDCRITLTKALGLPDQAPAEDLIERQTTFLSKLLRKMGFGADGLSAPSGAEPGVGAHEALPSDPTQPQSLPTPAPAVTPTAIELPGAASATVPGETVTQAAATTRTKDEETENPLDKVAPPGWEGTVQHMKDHPEIDNPWALAWWMHNQGDESHKYAKGAGACSCLDLQKKFAGERVGIGTPAVRKAVASADYPWSEALAKREFSDKKRSELADKGQALPNGAYPIQNGSDLENAIHAYGRSEKKGPEYAAKVKAHIITRAKDLGLTDKLPADWSGSTKEEKSSLATSLKKIQCHDFLTTSVASLAVLYDQMKQVEQELRYEAAREGGDKKDDTAADELHTLLLQVGALIADAAGHEVDEENEEAAEKCAAALTLHGITEETVAMAENIFTKRYSAAHKNHLHRAAMHLGKAITAEKTSHSHHTSAHSHLTKAIEHHEHAHEAMKKAVATHEAGDCAGSMEHLHKAMEHHEHAMAACAKAHEHHGHLESAIGDVEEHQELAHDHLTKAGPGGPEGANAPENATGPAGEDAVPQTPGAVIGATGPMDTSIGGGDGKITQAEMAAGGKKEAAAPAAAITTPAATPNTDGGEDTSMSKMISVEQAELEKKLAVAEAENALLKRQPAMSKGVAFDPNRLMPSPNPGSAEAVSLANDLFKGIDVQALDLSSPQDRGRMVSALLSNMNKNAAFARPLSDPNFRPPRSSVDGMRGTAAMPTIPRIG